MDNQNNKNKGPNRYHFIYHVTDHLYCYGPLFSYAGRNPGRDQL